MSNELIKYKLCCLIPMSLEAFNGDSLGVALPISSAERRLEMDVGICRSLASKPIHRQSGLATFTHQTIATLPRLNLLNPVSGWSHQETSACTS